MNLAPRDGRRVLLLLSNGWLVLGWYPQRLYDNKDLRYVRWHTNSNVEPADPETFPGKELWEVGMYPLGWWPLPESEWCWKYALANRAEKPEDK